MAAQLTAGPAGLFFSEPSPLGNVAAQLTDEVPPGLAGPVPDHDRQRPVIRAFAALPDGPGRWIAYTNAIQYGELLQFFLQQLTYEYIFKEIETT